jgi:hypothetical protein
VFRIKLDIVALIFFSRIWLHIVSAILLDIVSGIGLILYLGLDGYCVWDRLYIVSGIWWYTFCLGLVVSISMDILPRIE